MKVLIAEDELLVAMDMEACLIANGYTVSGIAASIDEALALLEGQVPDVALLDFNLRGRAVLPVAERLQELGVAVIVTSAYDAESIRQHAVLASAMFVSKPFSDSQLLLAIEAVERCA